MTDCKQLSFGFSRCKGPKVLADFDGGDISQEGRVLLLREVERQLGLLDRAAELLPDDRQAGRVVHEKRSLIKWPNQLRLLLSTLAYVLVDTLRTKALKSSELAHAQVTRIRLELLKIGAVVIRNTRRIIVQLSTGYPRR
ncbi:MAG: transposase [Verrucomicrobiota bacterium]